MKESTVALILAIFALSVSIIAILGVSLIMLANIGRSLNAQGRLDNHGNIIPKESIEERINELVD